jgi:hypothetical protein
VDGASPSSQQYKGRSIWATPLEARNAIDPGSFMRIQTCVFSRTSARQSSINRSVGISVDGSRFAT